MGTDGKLDVVGRRRQVRAIAQSAGVLNRMPRRNIKSILIVSHPGDTGHNHAFRSVKRLTESQAPGRLEPLVIQPAIRRRSVRQSCRCDQRLLSATCHSLLDVRVTWPAARPVCRFRQDHSPLVIDSRRHSHIQRMGSLRRLLQRQPIKPADRSGNGRTDDQEQRLRALHRLE